MNTFIEIPENVAVAVLQYLSQRPWNEVNDIIVTWSQTSKTMTRRSPRKSKSEVKD